MASPGGWTLCATINKVEVTPGGTKHVRQSEKYNYKAAAADESKDVERLRLDVKRNARQRALDRFDPVKTAAKKTKRRKRQN